MGDRCKRNGTRATEVTVVSAATPPDAVDALLDALADRGFACAAWEDVERGTSQVQIFLSDSSPASVRAASAALRDAGRALGLHLRPTTSMLPAQDWAESWKRFFHVMRASERVVIRPSWELYDPRPGEVVIVLDPGMSFGTGQHATTRACLVFLDRLAAADARRRVLDLGCGSGILAIAAAKLGFASVAALDNDPEAVAIARENGALNRVAATWQVGDLAHGRRQADVVVANILAPVLIEHAGRVTATVRAGPQAALVLSGILDSQYAAVRDAYAARGFVEQDTLLLGEWRTGLFKPVPVPAVG